MSKGKRRFLKLVVAAMLAGMLAAAMVVVYGYVAAPKVLRSAYRFPMPLSLGNFTPEQLQILLKVQDPNFYSHSGANLFTRDGVWTTISETLVKELYFSRYRSGFFHFRKVPVIFLAIGFDRRVSKDEQLRIYVNRVDLGEVDEKPVYGFAAAAEAFYGKRFLDLSRLEYLSLVAAIISPSPLNPRYNPQENQYRVRRIEHLLRGDCTRWWKGDVRLDPCFD